MLELPTLYSWRWEMIVDTRNLLADVFAMAARRLCHQLAVSRVRIRLPGKQTMMEFAFAGPGQSTVLVVMQCV